MISFSLLCSKQHQFESWFTSSAAYDVLQKAGHLLCPHCGDDAITKALMAPAIANAAPLKPRLTSLAADAPQPDGAAALSQLRQMIEENSDYVGKNFAAEARAMHLGDAPTRAIYGEAKAGEARALIEDGVPVAPLPFIPRAKVN